MTSRTFFRCRLIEQDRFVVDDLSIFVTTLTPDILVLALQRKCRPAIVVEDGRLPLGAVVAARTSSDLSRIGKLSSMDIRMAGFARARSQMKINIGQLDFEVRRFVTTRAGDRTMSSQQRKTRCGVIKVRQVIPAGDRMAGCTARLLAAGIHARHSVAELATVRIAVTGGAGAIFESILCNIFELRRQSSPVAIGASNGNMSPSQVETAVLVHGKSEGRWSKTLNRVALLTMIQMWHRCELPEMFVFMTIGARSEPQPINGGDSGRDMALRASHRRMLSFQWIRRSGMFL